MVRRSSLLDKDDKPQDPSPASSVLRSAGDAKDPIHLSLRVGHGVSGVVVCSIHMYLWVGCWGEIIHLDGWQMPKTPDILMSGLIP